MTIEEYLQSKGIPIGYHFYNDDTKTYISLEECISEFTAVKCSERDELWNDTIVDDSYYDDYGQLLWKIDFSKIPISAHDFDR